MYRQSQPAFLQHLTSLSDAYYNVGVPLVSDAEFDQLVEEYERTYSTKYTYLGAAPSHSSCSLPTFMPSLNKCKDEAAIERFKQAQPTHHLTYEYSEKLDGVSLLIQYFKSSAILLFTRGNGRNGTDVSHLLRHITIPSKIKGDLLVRGELILPRSYGEANLRNIVCGAVNAKTPNVSVLKNMHFVAYSLPGSGLTSEETFKRLTQLGFKVPLHMTRERCDLELCNEVYDLFASTSQYNIDGVVVAKNVAEPKAEDVENPKHVIAFKRTNNSKITKVRQVVWQHSRYGTSHPQVEIEPIELQGCRIQFISGVNARYIFTNNIGPGCEIEVQRSGEVIPNIMRVVTPAKMPAMPDEYKWDGVHIRLPDIEQAQDIARLTHSLKLLGAKGISQATVSDMFAAGFTTERAMWQATPEELEKVSRFGQLKAKGVYNALQAARANLDLKNLLLISACFSCFGERKLHNITSIVDVAAYLKDRSVMSALDLKNALPKISIKTQADEFLQGCDNFRASTYFMSLLDEVAEEDVMEDDVKQQPQPTTKQIRAVFSGFRPDHDLKVWCEQRNIKTNDSDVTKNVSCVVAKDLESSSSKVRAARKFNLPVYTLDEFKEHYKEQL